MKLRKSVARIVGLALLATPAAVAITSTADATETRSTTVTLDSPAATVIEYGDTTSISGTVKDNTGAYVDDGTVELQASAYPFTSWATVATDDAGSFYFPDLKPAISTRYRVLYDGYHAAASYENTYTPSAPSAVVTAGVARKLSVKSRGLHLWGKVAPASKLTLVFKKKVHGTYKKWFKVKTTKKGTWSTHLHGRIGTKAEIVLPASGGYVGEVKKGSII